MAQPTASFPPFFSRGLLPDRASIRCRHRSIVASIGWLMTAAVCFAAPSPNGGAFATGHYRNLFAEHLGKSEADLDAKIAAAWRQYTSGNPDTQRLFYTVPGDMTYVPDIKHEDVRTEGQSYGMMLAVQLDQQTEFDRIWRWTKKNMYHPDGPFAGYYAWHCRFDGSQIHAGPAPDGEEWFTMALFFAAHRWRRSAAGAASPGFDYEAEAQTLLRTMLHTSDDGDDALTPMFDRTAKQVVFVPHGPGSRFTDPSYHLPFFYELWARWAADPVDRAFLAELAPTSRGLFRNAAHPQTGLMPDYCSFEGRPFNRRGHEAFRFDAFRTLASVGLDWAWFAADPWQIEQSNRVLRFLAALGPNCPNNFALDGTPLTMDHSPGLFATAAVAALAADTPDARLFVERLWNMPPPDGIERY
jgi:oligosaccharide reducing-end xylanase